jgi:hypothetical protein
MSDRDSERRLYPRFAAPKGTIVAWHRFNKRAVSVVDNLGLGGTRFEVYLSIVH